MNVGLQSPNDSEYVTVERDGRYYELWLGFDLDGTIAVDRGWQGPDKIGFLLANSEAVALLIALYKIGQMKNSSGKKLFKVKIFTARACIEDHVQHIHKWVTSCPEFNFMDLDITCVKDYGCRGIFDDRAINVEKNLGKITSKPELLRDILEVLWKQSL